MDCNQEYKRHNKRIATTINDGKWKTLDSDDILWIPSGKLMSKTDKIISLDELCDTIHDIQNELTEIIERSIVYGLSPFPSTPNDDKVIIHPGKYRNFNNVKTIEYLGGISPSFQPISNYPRIDLIGLDDNKNIVIIMGAENNSPQPPLYPHNLTIVGEIYIDEKHDVIITTNDIKDVRDIIGSRISIIRGGTFL